MQTARWHAELAAELMLRLEETNGKVVDPRLVDEVHRLARVHALVALALAATGDAA